MIMVCTTRIVGVVATLVLWVQLSLAHYSLYISEEQLQSYYSGSVHAELVQDQMVEIVRDGEDLVAEDGSLLLSPIERASGVSGSGHTLSVRSMERTLPPLPAGVGMVHFTWVANTMVNYTLVAGQKDGQLSNPMFNVSRTGLIPQNPETLQLTLSCEALFLKLGKVEVNLTTTTNQSDTPLPVSFFLTKSCNDTETETPSLSTVFPQSTTLQEPTSTLILLSSSLLLTPTPPQSPPPSFLQTPSLYPLPLPPTLIPSVSVTLSLTAPLNSSSLGSSLPPLLPLPDTPSLSLLHSVSPSPLSTLRTYSSLLSLTPSPSLFSLSLSPSHSPLTISTSPSPLSLSTSPSPLSLFPSHSPLSPSPSRSPLSLFPSHSPLSPSPSRSPLSLSPSHSPFTLSPSPSPLSISPSPPSLSTFTLSPFETSHSLLSSPPLTIFPTSPQSTLPTTFFTPSPSTLGPKTSISTPSSMSPLPSTSSLSTDASSRKPQPSSFLSSGSSLPISSSPLSLTHSFVGDSPSFSPRVSTSELTMSGTLDPVHSKISGDITVQPSSSGILTEQEPAESASMSRLLVFVCAPLGGILLACIVLSCCILLCVKYRSRGKKATHAFSDDPLDVVHTVPFSSDPDEDAKKEAQPPLSLWMNLPWGVVSGLPRSLQTLVAQLGVDRINLSIIDTITRGEYGSVVSGQLSNFRGDVMLGSQSVSIKMLTGFPEGTRRDEVVRFLEASTLMKGIQHCHLLPVLHVSVEDNYVPLVIYPTVQYGDMHRVMKLAADPEHSVLPPLTTKLTLELAIQIATAMSYLADHGIIHPDLALRNCLLDSACTVKVSDGALAQQFYPECYYTLFGATRPVRWAAVETLQEGLCAVRSNVWSYAVTVWEILTFAEMPYSEVNNNRSILSTIKMGARLPQPHTCPEPLYELLGNCWKDRGEERPSFTTLIYHLQQLLLQYSDHLRDSKVEPQSSIAYGNDRHTFSSSIGMSVSRERLPHSGDSPRPRHHIAHRDTSQGSLKRVSMASMLSRGSTADKLSVTFSALSVDIGSNSEDETDLENGGHLQTLTSRHSMLHPVDASFIDPIIEKTTPPSISQDDTCSSINTAILSDISSHTLVPPANPSPARSLKSAVVDEITSLTSSNPISLTPPPSQATDTHSKTSTMDLESVSTAPYSSSPLQSTTFLYPTTTGNGYGIGSSLERGDHSPLLVGHKARNAHPAPFLPSRPSAKSTDSGIRSDEDPELIHFPSAYTPPGAESVSGRPQDMRGNDSGGLGLGTSDLSSSLMAAFDSWDSTGN